MKNPAQDDKLPIVIQKGTPVCLYAYRREIVSRDGVHELCSVCRRQSGASRINRHTVEKFIRVEIKDGILGIDLAPTTRFLKFVTRPYSAESEWTLRFQQWLYIRWWRSISIIRTNNRIDFQHVLSRSTVELSNKISFIFDNCFAKTVSIVSNGSLGMAPSEFPGKSPMQCLISWYHAHLGTWQIFEGIRMV